MPELPEVETIKNGINLHLPKDKIKKVTLNRDDLRFPLPKHKILKLKNQTIKPFERRGKFLIFKSEDLNFISHLGMTGHWRFEKNLKLIKHDHVIISWDNTHLIYNDPRRFGYILELQKNTFSDFGPDPILDKIDFNKIYNDTRTLKTNVKSWLLNQKNILGVGNIYASEILFLSCIHPLTVISDLDKKNILCILENTKKVLLQAISKGGSSLRDYKNVDGASGDMQNHWAVYGKENQPCSVCKSKIAKIVISNRSTYFCKKCQN